MRLETAFHEIDQTCAMGATSSITFAPDLLKLVLFIEFRIIPVGCLRRLLITDFSSQFYRQSESSSVIQELNPNNLVLS